MSAPPAGPLLLFDGGCALCHRTVRFLLRADRRGALRYAPLDGETAAALAPRWPQIGGIDSVVLIAAQRGELRVALRSAAVIGALRLAGGPWRLAASLLALVPRPLRDRAYDVVAKRRQRWFGRYPNCPPPPAAWRDRFLP